MATSSSKTTIDEEPQENYIWVELKLLQSIVMQSRLGQTVLKLMDNFLWTVEKCLEWSLPRQAVEDKKDSEKIELVRPLPWLLFLPSLVMLRIIRVTVNIGASILSYPKITPSEMIKFMQKSRRYLHGAMKKEKKERYELKDKRSMNETKKALIRSIRLTLSSLSCLDASKSSPSPPPTKIYVSSNLDSDLVTTISEEKSKEKSKENSKEESESMDSTVTLKNSMSESEEEKKEIKEEKETLKEKIDRLASENSEDDEDFEPNKYTSSNVSSDDDENDGNVSSNEIRDIIEDAELFKKKIIEFLNAEQTSALACKQEPVESACEKRSSAKENRDKVEECLAALQCIDSECGTPDRSSQEGDPIFYSPISSDSDTPKKPSVSVAEQSKSFEQNNSTIAKRNINVSKRHKGKRTSRGNHKKK